MTVRTLLASAVLGAALLASPALAHPFDGAWEERHPTDKSIKGVTTPDNFKLTIWMKVNGENLDYWSENTTREQPYISEHVSKLDGTVTDFPKQTRFNKVSTLQTEPHELQILKMKDNDVIAGEFWTFSRDGKTAVRRGIAKNAEGRSYPYQEHFVKVNTQPKFRK
jgi:hypothetical protein